MRIVLVAEESAGSRVLQQLASTSHQLVAVLSSPPDGTGPGSRVWQDAEKLGVKTVPVSVVKEPGFQDELRDQAVDLLLNVHSLTVLPAAVLTAPRHGCFNLHPGPLPRYAGLNTVSWAIYRGERRYGVTLHKMEASIDAGAIAALAPFEIGERDNALKVYTKCLQLGLPLVSKLIDDLATSPPGVILTPQDLSRREYYRPAPPDGGRVDWSSSARQIWNFVKACDYHPFPSPWGHPRTALGGREVMLASVEPTAQPCDALPGSVGEASEAGALVACGDEWLRVKRLLCDGKRVPAATLLQRGDRFARAAGED